MAESQWTKKEWEQVREKLEQLSLKELRDLTTKVGIRFTIGNDKITDSDEFVLVLDEADRKELECEYNKIAANKPKRRRRVEPVSSEERP